MTGYGNVVVAYKNKKIHVEVKSLNGKNLDITTRIAPVYREKEMEIRQMLTTAQPPSMLRSWSIITIKYATFRSGRAYPNPTTGSFCSLGCLMC